MEKVGENLNVTTNNVLSFSSSAENATLPASFHQDGSLLEAVFKCVAYSLVLVLSVIGNSLVMAAFKLNINRKLRTVNNMFIVSMAAGDLLLTVASTPERITRILADERWIIEGNLGIFLCKTTNYLEKLCMNVSVIHLAMIAIDRFLVVFFPHRKIITETRARIIIIIAWLGSAVYCVPLFYYANLVEKNGRFFCKTRRFFNNWKVWYLFFLSLLVLTLLLVVALYAAIIIRLWCGKTPEMQIPLKSRISARINSRVLKMVAVIVCAFYSCVLPYWVGWVFCSYLPKDLICNNTYVFIAIFLMYANSAVNPVIYAFFNDAFRVGFRFILTRPFSCCLSLSDSSVMETARDGFIGRIRSSKKSSEIQCQELKQINPGKDRCIYV